MYTYKIWDKKSPINGVKAADVLKIHGISEGEVGFRGIFKKVLIFTMVAVGNLIDRSIIGNGEVIRTAVIFFYLSNEGISILENAGKIGLPIPEKLKDILSQLKNKPGGGKGDDK
jgi:toxin secretion/phage lysis holin